MSEHSTARAFLNKVLKDNITMLASVVAWGVLSSIIQILVGLIAISSFVLSDPQRQRIIIDHLSEVLQHVLTANDLRSLVHLVVNHTGLLLVLGAVGVLWGASNVGGAISTVFQPIFQVRGRPLPHEKLIDIGMIFVFTILMLVIIIGSTAGEVLNHLLANAPTSGATSFVIGTAISLLAAFLLFFVIYAIFPNIEHRFRLGNVWRGAAVGAALFQLLSYVWPLYGHFVHPQRYGAILAPIVVLGVWIYFFSLVLVLGAEVVAFGALREAKAAGMAIGPAPDGTVPQRMDVGQNSLAVVQSDGEGGEHGDSTRSG